MGWAPAGCYMSEPEIQYPCFYCAKEYTTKLNEHGYPVNDFCSTFCEDTYISTTKYRQNKYGNYDYEDDD